MPALTRALSIAKKALAALETAEADAIELVSRLAGVGRGEVATEGARALDDAQIATLEQWIERRLRGEPVQYITGRAAFRSIDLSVTPAVLIPRPETEWLVEAVLETLRDARGRWPDARVLDLGTGSGAIALAIAGEHPSARVTAIDSRAEALDVARQNAVALGMGDRVRFLEGEWFDPLGADDRFEVVVSNPPYIATSEWDGLPDDVKLFEPHTALFSGASGLEAVRDIVDLAPDHLVTGGLLALELAESRAEEVAGWFEGARDWAGAELRDDLAGRPRVLLARRQTGPAIAPLQWPEDP